MLFHSRLWILIQQKLGLSSRRSGSRIMQINVEGLSAAKRHIMQSLAEIHHIDVICLQETYVNDDKSDRLTISGFDIISYTLHAKHGRAIMFAATSLMLRGVVVSVLWCHSCGRISHCQRLQITNWTLEQHLPLVLPRPAFLVGDFIARVWRYRWR